MVTTRSGGSDLDPKKPRKENRRCRKKEMKDRKKETKKEKKHRKRRMLVPKHDDPNPTFPLRRSPRCRRCFGKARRFKVKASNAHNAGRPYYVCIRCKGRWTVDGTVAGVKFITFDDNIGVRQEHRVCDCSLYCRRGVGASDSTESGKKYLQCPIGRCGYFRWMDNIGMKWDGVEELDTSNMDQHQADSPCRISQAISDDHDHSSNVGNGVKVKKEEEVTYGPTIEVHTTLSKEDLARLKAEPEGTSLLTVLQRSYKKRKTERDDDHTQQVKLEVGEEDAVALMKHRAIEQEQNIKQETALDSARLRPYPHFPPLPNLKAITDVAPIAQRFETPIIKQESTLLDQTGSGPDHPPISTEHAKPATLFPNHPDRPSRHRSRAPSPSPAARPYSPSSPQAHTTATHRPPSTTPFSAIEHGMAEARKLAKLAAMNARKSRDEQQSLNALQPHNDNRLQPASTPPSGGQDSHKQDSHQDDAELFDLPDSRTGLTGPQLRVLKGCIGRWEGSEDLWRPFIADRATYLTIYGSIAR